MPASTPGPVGQVDPQALERARVAVRRREHPAPVARRLGDPARELAAVLGGERPLELLDPAAVLAERRDDRLAVVEEDVDPDARIGAGDPRHVAQRAAGRLERVVTVDAGRAGLVEQDVRERVRQVARDRDEPVVGAGVDRDGPRAERRDEAVHRAEQLRARSRRSASGTTSRPRTARRSRGRGRASRRRRSDARRRSGRRLPRRRTRRSSSSRRR